MCGIVGFAGKERAVPYLLDCLERLEYRGYDSAGIALSEEKGLEVIKSKGRLSVLTSKIMAKKQNNSSCGIGHTRWATHGSPKDINAHPQLSNKGTFAVVHNGIIENYRVLKKELMLQGVTFSSETDTEVIAQLLEKNYEGDFLEAVRKTLPLLEGSYAVAILCKDFPGKIFCTRWGSPIVLAKTSQGSFISSDVTSILKYTDEIYKLDGGEGALVDSGKIEFFDREMKRIEKSAEKVPWNLDSAEKKGYEHFMLKEIFEQSETVERTVREYVRKGEIVFPDLHFSKKELRDIKSLVFVGCGSAYHAGLWAKYLTQRLTGLQCSAEIASEWRYGNSPLDSSCLFIAVSQSGETADTLAALRRAKQMGAKTLAVVNVTGSSVASESDCVLYTRAGPEIAVATTKAYTAQLVNLFLFILKAGCDRGEINKEKRTALINELIKASEKISTLLQKLQKTLPPLSKELYTSGQIYFIGRNTDYAAAMEGALKLKEISYIPCEAYGAGELKHGTISLIEKGTPVVALLGNGELFSKTVSNIREVKARGARVIALCPENKTEEIKEFCERIIELPEGESALSAVYEGVALQLLAYYTAKSLGNDIDKPRNLAKSVTVE